VVKQELGFMKRKYRTGILAGMQCIVVDVGLIILASLCVSLILPGGTRGKTFSDPAFFLCALLFFLFSLYFKTKAGFSWGVTASSLVIPTTIFICLLPVMNNYIGIRLGGVILLPVVAISIILAIKESKN
jgi:hypothetical protein